jgi:hypothetical protein
LSDPSIVYEVRCQECRVSFPPGTRACFYCGAPLAAGPEVSLGAELEEGEATRRAVPFRTALTLIWVLLAIAGSIARACSGS